MVMKILPGSGSLWRYYGTWIWILMEILPRSGSLFAWIRIFIKILFGSGSVLRFYLMLPDLVKLLSWIQIHHKTGVDPKRWMIHIFLVRLTMRSATSPTPLLRACARSSPRMRRRGRQRRPARRPQRPPRPPGSRPSCSSPSPS